MSLNAKCPRCGSTNVQLTSEKSKHGCLWLFLFGILYLIWIPIKWCIGLLVLLLVDWWVALVKKKQGKIYVWKSRGFFTLSKRYYYCHNCSNNFKY